MKILRGVMNLSLHGLSLVKGFINRLSMTLWHISFIEELIFTFKLLNNFIDKFGRNLSCFLLSSKFLLSQSILSF